MLWWDVLGFNVSVAHVWADREHLLEKRGQRMPVEDGYIAATARRHGLTIVTGNDKDFRRPGLKVFNPLTRPADNRRTMVSRQCPDSSHPTRQISTT